MHSAEPGHDFAQLVARYQALVVRYEALDTEIDDLLMAHGGHTEDLPTIDLRRYRALARERDDVESELRTLEQQLNLNDEPPSGELP
ncbi:MAG TPA: hypothetical protein VER79_02060 [Candidatus Limnocylindrales bacterium]|jgi:hypothetical protein|nr:hypothetical protein [Candidatus Limnocylindrales bacterium]